MNIEQQDRCNELYVTLMAYAMQRRYLNRRQLQAHQGRALMQRLNLLSGQYALCDLFDAPPAVLDALMLARAYLAPYKTRDRPCTKCGALHARRHVWCAACHRRHKQKELDHGPRPRR